MNSLEPILAEIADKMPTLNELWGGSFMIGAFVAALTAVFSAIRLWLGGMMDRLVVRELGTSYLYQQRLSCFVPCTLATLAWWIVWLMKRSHHSITEER